MKTRFLSLLPLALAAVLTHAGALGADLKLRILETTDVHMNLLNYDYYQDRITHEYGLAKAITLIKAARAESRNSLLLDNGDLIQGSPLGDVVARVKPLAVGQVHPAFKVMNQLGVRRRQHRQPRVQLRPAVPAPGHRRRELPLRQRQCARGRRRASRR